MWSHEVAVLLNAYGKNGEERKKDLKTKGEVLSWKAGMQTSKELLSTEEVKQFTLSVQNLIVF